MDNTGEKQSKEIIQQPEIVLYQMDGTNVYIHVYYQNETFWFTQKAMAKLFGVNPQAITKHPGNIYTEELERDSTCSKVEQVRQQPEISSSLVIALDLAYHKKIYCNSEYLSCVKLQNQMLRC